MGLFDFLKKIKNDAAAAADAVIPGDQSSWHQGTPTPNVGQAVQGFASGAAHAVNEGIQAVTNPGSLLSRFGEQNKQPAAPQKPIFTVQPFNNVVQTATNPARAIVAGVQDAMLPKAQQPKPPSIAANPLAAGISKAAELGTNLAQGAARIAPQVGLQLAEMGNAAVTGQKQDITVDPNTNPAMRALFGDQPIRSYQGQADQFTQWLQQHGVDQTKAGAAGVVTAPLLAGLDLATGGRGKAVADQLAKETTKEGVQKIIEKELGQNAGRLNTDAIQAIAATTKPEEVKNILDQAITTPHIDQVKNAAQQMVDQVTPHNDNFGANLQQIADNLGETSHQGPIKTVDRLAQKAHNDYAGDVSQVRDAVRGTIPISDPAQLQTHIDEIAQHYPITRIKNGLDNPGYKDVKVNVQLPSGHEAEIQIATPEMISAKKELGGHKLYNQVRIKEGDWQAAEAHMNELYANADQAAASRVASSAEISRPSESALSGGNGLAVRNTTPTISPEADLSTRTITSSTSKNLGNGVDNAGILLPSNIVTQSANDVKQLAETATDTQLANLADSNPELVQEISRYRSENNLPNVAGNGQERKFVETVRANEAAAPEIRQGVEGSYEPISNPQSLAEADHQIQQMGFDAALHTAKTANDGSRLTQAMRLRVSDDLQARGLAAKNAGDEATAKALFSDAIDVLNKAAERATVNGQDTQILAAYQRLTPEGIVQFAAKGIERAKEENPKRFAGLKLDENVAAELRQKAEAIQAMPDGMQKQIATYNLLKDVQRTVPSTFLAKSITLWKASLLTGIKGQLGNQVGNSAHLLMRKLADVPAAGIDAAIGSISRQRGKTFTLKGILPGIGEGFRAAGQIVRHGFDAKTIVNDKYDVGKVFFSKKNPLGIAAQKYTDTIFRLTGAGDRPYYYATLRNSLADLAMAAAKTQRIPRSERQAFIKEFLSAPPEEALVRATADAQEAIFADDSAIGQALKGFKRGLTGKGGPLGEAAAEINAPFTGVPSSIATAVINFSPAGGIKAIYDAMRSARGTGFTPAVQRELSTALGRSVTGTGIMWLGYKTMLDGRMTLGYPKDAQDRALWQQEGKQPYSVLIGGKWRSLNYTGPMMALMAIGGQVADAEKQGQDTLGSLATGAGGAAQSIIGSSPLKGIQGGLDVINDPQRNAKSYVNNLAGSVVPTLVKDTSNALDSTKRTVNGPLDAIKARIPGQREKLAPAIDEFGQQVQQDPTGWTAILDPFKSTSAQTTPLVDELQRLQDAGQGIVPPKQNAGVSFGGQKVKLDPGQLHDYQQKIGGAITSAWSDLYQSPEYQALSDSDKKAALQRASEAVVKATDARFAADNNLGNVSKAQDLGGVAAMVAAGHTDPRIFTVDSADWPADLKLQQLQDAYAADSSRGALSTVQDYKRRQEISNAQAKVDQPTTKSIQEKYSTDAVTFAGLSKAAQASLIASGGVTQDIVDQAAAYKQELKTSRPRVATGTGRAKGKGSRGGKVAIRKGSSGKGKAPKGFKLAKTPKLAKPKGKVTKIATAKAVKLNLPKPAKAVA